MKLVFDVPPGAPRVALDQLLHWGRIVETGDMQPGQPLIDVNVQGPAAAVAQHPVALPSVFTPGNAETFAGLPIHPGNPPAAPLPGGMVEYAQSTGLAPPTPVAAAPVVAAEAEQPARPKRGGRISNAEKERRRLEAEKAAQHTAQTAAAAGLIPGVPAAAPSPVPVGVSPPALPPSPVQQPAQQPQQVQQPQPIQAPGGYIPPAMPQPVAPAAATPAPASYTPPAMPQPIAAPRANGGGVLPLEELRAACIQFNRSHVGLWASVAKSPVWPDGTPKPAWYTLEAVPEAERARLLASVESMAMAAPSA